MNKPLLPGTEFQYRRLKNSPVEQNIPILFIGAGNEFFADKFSKKFKVDAELIVEDYETLISAKLLLQENSAVTTRIMDFARTDFDDKQFKCVYAQASVSNPDRNKIIKEIKRILQPEGFLIVGEIVKIRKDIPAYVNDILTSSQLSLLDSEEITSYYEQRNFTVIEECEEKRGLDEYYELCSVIMKNNVNLMDEDELKYNKKLIKKARHETDAYLKLGLDKFISFKILVLQKNDAK